MFLKWFEIGLLKIKDIVKGPLSYKYIMTYVDVYESIHHKIITC